MIKPSGLVTVFPLVAASGLLISVPFFSVASVEPSSARACLATCRGCVDSYREWVQEDEAGSEESRAKCLAAIDAFDSSLASVAADSSLTGRAMLDKVIEASGQGASECRADGSDSFVAISGEMFGTCGTIASNFIDVYGSSPLQRLMR